MSSITLRLVDKNDRSIKAYQMAEKLQSQINNIIKKKLKFVKDIEVM
jgi:hypothetical protein